MMAAYGYLRRVRPMWMSAWPIGALVLLASLADMRVLPAGYARAVVAVPIAFLVPGSLTVCAAFGGRNRPRGKVFIGYAALLSVLWLAFTSLALYMLHILITAASTYCSMLGLCTILTLLAETRLLTERPAVGRRATGNPNTFDRELSATNNGSGAVRSSRFATIVAIVAGVGLLVGGVYYYDHLPHPAPEGYTQLFWTGVDGNVIAVGPRGTRLYYKIVDQYSTWARYRLSAVWEGSSARSLAKPLTFGMSPGQTLRGNLLVPPLPGQCTYRIVITLVAIGQEDPLTKQQPTWSIDANVNESGNSRSACA